MLTFTLAKGSTQALFIVVTGGYARNIERKRGVKKRTLTNKLMKWTPLPYTETSVSSREVIYGKAKSDRNRPGKVGDSDSR